jgi:bifunctional aspartokinase / homoserine dehydrogenase 1
MRCAAQPQISERPHILKFGGTSVATPQRIRAVAKIVRESASRAPAIVVVSAFSGVTNELLECATLAARQDPEYVRSYGRLARRHRSTVDSLLRGDVRQRARASVDELFCDLSAALRDIRLERHASASALDEVASFGERLSCRIVAAYLDTFRPARFVDARQFVVTDDDFTRAKVNFSATNPAVAQFFLALSQEPQPPIPVVTGFIGSTAQGRTTTIGRNGSDYSAAIIGAAVGASMIAIWTDVDGILTADPNETSSAFVLPQLTYQEALDLCRCGAKVLHADAIGPAVARSIPIAIRNSFDPGAPGTLITGKARASSRLAVGISSLADIVLFSLRTSARTTLESRTTAERLLRALRANGVTALLRSTASDGTICLAVKEIDREIVEHTVTAVFGLQLREGLAALERKHRQAIITVVGTRTTHRGDISAKASAALARHSLAISAVVREPSGYNVSYVIDDIERLRAVALIHDALFDTRDLRDAAI